MTNLRRLLLLLAAVLVAVPVAAAPAVADDDAPGGSDNAAVAVNTEDGASVFRLAFSVRTVANGVVDETNSAYALASCVDCQTVALAFQVVLVRGDADVVVPENLALAYNEQCVECLTYASATQIVIGVDGPTRLSGDGRRRLGQLYRSLRDLEDQIGDMTASELHAAVTAAKTELVAILSEELVPAGRDEGEEGEDVDDAQATSTTSTTVDTSTSTSTTVEEDTATTTSTESTTSTTAAG